MKTQFLHIVFISLLPIALLLGQTENSSSVGVSGGISLGFLYNKNFIGDERYLPTSYTLSGNLSLQYEKFTLPFHLYFNNRNIGLRRSAIFLGVSPTIKKTKLHVGFSNMTFSKYFLNGSTFLGLGVETEWKGLRVLTMGGRLKNILPTAPNENLSGLEFFKEYNRSVYALKLGLDVKNQKSDLLLFYGKDLFSFAGINDELDRNIELLPKENVGIGLSGRYKIFGRFSFGYETIISAFTENADQDDIDLGGRFRFLTNLFNPNLSTFVSYAGTARVGYSDNFGSLNAQVERVSPEFKTIGTYYYYNDFVNYSLNLSRHFVDRRLYISATYGLQKNNLSFRTINKSTKQIYSINLKYRGADRFTLSGRYNNYNLDRSPDIEEIGDSLRVVTVQSSGQLMPAYSFGKDKKYKVRALLNYRQAENKFSLESQSSNTDIFLGKLMLSSKMGKWNLNLGAGYTHFGLEQFPKSTKTANIRLRRPFFNRSLTLSLGSSYNITDVIGKSNGYYVRSTSTISYNLNNSVNMNFGLYHYYRKANVGEDRSDLQVQSRISLRL